METFRDFDEAVEEWRATGGAMTVHQPTTSDPTDLWEVGGAEDIEKATGCDAKERTLWALQIGGMSEADIAKEMLDWND